MKTSLYYDGACPLCAKEVALVKRLVKHPIDFIDIHTLNDSFLPSKEALLKHLHLRKASGEWLLGLDANIYMWSYTSYGFLFKLLKLWPIYFFATYTYEKWATKRFEKRYQCQSCSKSFFTSKSE